MIIQTYITPTKIEDALRELRQLPSDIRPTHFSADEDRNKAKGQVEDVAKFRAFRAKNEYGFFLFAKRGRYDFSLRAKNGFATVVVDDEESNELTDSDAIAILQVFASANAAFAFAAAEDEYHHRNRYVRSIGANQFETWLGRDLGRYLPGIYWLTVLSSEHSAVLSKLPSSLNATVTELDPGHWLVRAFDSPTEWQRCAARIDEWIASEPAFFSKKRVVSRLDTAPNIGALIELAGEWP